MKTTADTATSKPAAKKNRRPGATWGGARPGAGAKKGRPRPAGAGTPNLKPGETSKAFFFRMAQSDAIALENLAKNHNKKISELIREMVIDFLAKNNT